MLITFQLISICFRVFPGDKGMAHSFFVHGIYYSELVLGYGLPYTVTLGQGSVALQGSQSMIPCNARPIIFIFYESHPLSFVCSPVLQKRVEQGIPNEEVHIHKHIKLHKHLKHVPQSSNYLYCILNTSNITCHF